MRSRFRAGAGLVVVALSLLVAGAYAPGAAAASPATPFAQPKLGERRNLTESSAIATFLRKGKVADWVARYPRRSLVTEARYEPAYRDWVVYVWSGPAGEIATGRVDDVTGVVSEAWTGPQVAWTMARGEDGAFGGKTINTVPVWLVLCAVFLVGLADLRRPLSLRNLDLLGLLSFSLSLWYFNRGHVFASASLAVPPLVYLLVRTSWIGVRGRPPAASPPVWPVWVLVAGAIFLAGFRIGLDVSDSRVIDVGYSGVIGAQRIATGQVPYGHFPQEVGKPCAPADRDGRQPYRIQPNGRCEAADANGDTYGPVAYETYLPGYWLFGWKGIGDTLDAAKFTSIVFDALCAIGLFLVGRRYGGNRLGATLLFAWEAYPFNQYVLGSNTNDAIQPAFLVFGFWLATSPWARGAAVSLAGWTKFAALLVGPLWATYPEARLRPRPLAAFVAAFTAVTVAAFAIALLDPHPFHTLSVFWHRTIASQLDRQSPFSIWDWRQYHAGLPDLHLLQRLLQVALVVGAIAVAFLPRRKTPLQLAALTAAVLIGFQLVLTHWFYLYLPWFFPFVAFAVLAPVAHLAAEAVPERRERPAGELVPAR